MTFQPLTNYSGYEHVLNALPCFVHPANGNLYGIAIEKQAGVRQNLSVYRVRPGANARELVHRFVGGIDSAAQIAAGGCIVHPDGSLEVWASAVPMGIPPITKTGFVGGFWPRIPDVDDPYTLGVGSALTLLPAPRTAQAWEGRQLAANTGEWVDIPAVFGVLEADAYLLRFVAQSDAADVRVRAGTEQAPYFLTLNTQLPHVQMHAQGWAPGPRVWVSTAQGQATVWLQVCGHG